jgi:3-hydroxyisobutyrate dehydrogenase-like beta-hydroxyacid dehydrogenase
MVGGDPAVFERAKPVLDLYARSCALIGPAGSGQLTKMVNQICVIGVIQGLAEGLNFGRRAGLDMEKALSVIGKGAATSWQSACAGLIRDIGEMTRDGQTDVKRLCRITIHDSRRRRAFERPA